MIKRIRAHIQGATTVFTLWPQPCEIQLLLPPARIQLAKKPATDEEALQEDWSKVGADLQTALRRVLPEDRENVEIERS